MSAAPQARPVPNQVLLGRCPLPHDFSIPIDFVSRKRLEAPAPFCAWMCARCGGQVFGSDKEWYNLGMRQAKT
jgi:hypothetical protein